MEMNLLLFNLATDNTHVTLSFGIRWINELARHFKHIDVVTMYEGTYTLPDNVSVWSVGREKGYSKFRRVLMFYLVVFRIIRRRRIDVVFTHMIHSFAILFWPIGKALGIRNALWYAHGAVPISLRFAHRAADAVVTSTPEGFRIPSRKVTFVGQGVDVSEFVRTAPNANPSEFRIVYVGRISPVKGIDQIIEALHGWRAPDGRPWRLDIVGAAASPEEAIYEASLRAKQLDPAAGGRVHFHGRLGSAGVREYLRDADVFMSVSRNGSLDKVIVEAMSARCAVLSSNEAFLAIARKEGLLDCCLDGTPNSIAEGLTRIAAMNESARENLTERLREIAVRDHSLDNLIGKLTKVLTALASEKAHAT
jgi:glycosyltransferase involved in cell wall biosynthesis